MKHLRKFNESNFEDKVELIEDLLLQLKDDGFSVSLHNNKKFIYAEITYKEYHLKNPGSYNLDVNGVVIWAKFDLHKLDFEKRIDEFIDDCNSYELYPKYHKLGNWYCQLKFEYISDITESKTTKVSKKVELLKDLSLQLKDEGFDVEVYSGNGWIHLSKYNHNDIDSKSIYVEISYKNYNAYSGIIYRQGYLPGFDSDISKDDFNSKVKEFIKDCESYGLKPRGCSSGDWYYFIQFDKRAKSDYINMLESKNIFNK